MATDWTAKQGGFVRRYQPLVMQFLQIADDLKVMNEEFVSNAYGTGGAHEITDANVQPLLPAITAAEFNSAEGAVVTIMAAVDANRGYLELLRP